MPHYVDKSTYITACLWQACQPKFITNFKPSDKLIFLV